MDHSHMDHSNMDHSHMDHGGMGGHDGMDMGNMCSMNMLFTWDTNNLCIVFRWARVSGPLSLVVALLLTVAICAGYEWMRDLTRRFDAFDRREDEAAPRRTGSGNSTGGSAAASVVGAKGSERRRLVKAVLYAVQNFYAFMIMLIFMTYNGWVMLAVAVGAGLGYWLFGAHTPATKETACH